MRISEWSSDVCSSDLHCVGLLCDRARTAALELGAGVQGMTMEQGGASSMSTLPFLRNFDLTGQVALVTGSARGLGRSAERRVGQEWCSTGRSRWTQFQ